MCEYQRHSVSYIREKSNMSVLLSAVVEKFINMSVTLPTAEEKYVFGLVCCFTSQSTAKSRQYGQFT